MTCTIVSRVVRKVYCPTVAGARDLRSWIPIKSRSALNSATALGFDTEFGLMSEGLKVKIQVAMVVPPVVDGLNRGGATKLVRCLRGSPAPELKYKWTNNVDNGDRVGAVIDNARLLKLIELVEIVRKKLMSSLVGAARSGESNMAGLAF